MKAIILAAGPTMSAEQLNNQHYFPPDSKPKCLFHFGGGSTLFPEKETLLERQVRVLNECGVTDIRVVVGWKKEMIQQFIEKEKLNVETVYNPDYPHDFSGKSSRGYLDGLQSVRVGLQGVYDDVLIMPSDVALHKIGVTRILQEKYKQAIICYHIVKITKEKLPLLREYRKPGFMLSLYDFIMECDGLIIGKGAHSLTDAERAAKALRTDDPEFIPYIYDVDYYLQTNEGIDMVKKLGMTGEEFVALPIGEIIRLLREESAKF